MPTIFSMKLEQILGQEIRVRKASEQNLAEL